MAVFNPDSLAKLAVKNLLRQLDEAYDKRQKSFDMSDRDICFVISLLRSHGNEESQVNALNIISKISFNFPFNLFHRFVNLNLVPVLVQVLKNHFVFDTLATSGFCILQIVKTLAVMSCDVRDQIVTAGIFEDVLCRIDSLVFDPTFLACSCLPPDTRDPPSVAFLARIIPVLYHMLRTKFTGPQRSILECINALPLDVDDYAKAFFEHPIMPVLESLTSSWHNLVARLSCKVVNTINTTLALDSLPSLFET